MISLSDSSTMSRHDLRKALRDTFPPNPHIHFHCTSSCINTWHILSETCGYCRGAPDPRLVGYHIEGYTSGYFSGSLISYIPRPSEGRPNLYPSGKGVMLQKGDGTGVVVHEITGETIKDIKFVKIDTHKANEHGKPEALTCDHDALFADKERTLKILFTVCSFSSFPICFVKGHKLNG